MVSDSGLRRISGGGVASERENASWPARDQATFSSIDIVTAEASEKTWDWAYAGRECLQID